MQVERKIAHTQYILMRHLINTGHKNSVDAVDDFWLSYRHVEHVHVRKSCPVLVKFKIDIIVINYFFGGQHFKSIFSYFRILLYSVDHLIAIC